MFPRERPRRLRHKDSIRRMVEETQLLAANLVYPLFIVEGTGIRQEIDSMPGVFRLSADQAVAEVGMARSLGIRAVLLFGIPNRKDPEGSSSWAEDGAVQVAVRMLLEKHPDIYVITDVCLCEYTDHGHCGLVEDGTIANDPTLDLLARQALSHARAGAHMVAPSDMMDGRVGRIRDALDADGFSDVSIMSYAVKYASAFYGPFREAARSAPVFGDRRGYQMNPANSREALREVRLDVAEGADVVMVKPAMPCLDIITRVRDEVDVPVAAYQVSGEFAMIRAAGKNGWLNEDAVVLESLLAARRAGASLVMTYFAPLAARLLET